jgi:hypothetical protein
MKSGPDAVTMCGSVVIQAFRTKIQAKRSTYLSILQDYLTTSQSPSVLLSSLLTLMNDSALTDVLGVGLKAPSAERPHFLQLWVIVRTMLTPYPDAFHYVNTLMWLLLHELVPCGYLEKKLALFALPPIVLSTLLPLLAQLATEELVLRSRLMLLHCFIVRSPNVFIPPSVRPSQAVHLYVVARLELHSSEMHMASFVKCVSAIAIAVLPFDYGVSWMERINPDIACLLTKCANFPIGLHPSLVLGEIPQDYWKWVFGDMLLRLLADIPPLRGQSLLDSARVALSNPSKRRRELSLHMTELRSVKLFHALKFCVHAIRANTLDFQPIQVILSSLLGFVPSTFPPSSLHFIVKKCIEHGRLAHFELTQRLKRQLSSIEISTPDWRLIFANMLRLQFVRRSVIYSRFSMQLSSPEVQQKCKRLVDTFIGTFSQLDQVWSEFLGLFSPGHYFCVFDTVHAIVCYSELLTMCESVEDIDPTIGLHVFANDPPIPQYRDKPVGNIDLVLVPFAKSLKKMGVEHFSLQLSQIITSFDDDFIFEIVTDTNSLKVSWLVNPMEYIVPQVLPHIKERRHEDDD